MTLGDEGLATVLEIADEALVAIVCPHMSLEVSDLSESFTTKLALMWFLAGVSVQMNLQSIRPLVFLTAYPTFEWLLSGVDHFMCFQITSRNEAFAAIFEIADERLFSEVRPHMNLKIMSRPQVLHAV